MKALRVQEYGKFVFGETPDLQPRDDEFIVRFKVWDLRKRCARFGRFHGAPDPSGHHGP